MKRKEFKNKLRQLPPDIYDEVAKVLAEYGITNVKVNRIQITPLDILDTKEKCEAAGKIWQCDIIDGRDEPYCRCLNNT